MKTIHTILFLAIAFISLSAQNQRRIVNVDELFRYEVLNPQFGKEKYRAYKDEYKSAEGSKKLGVVTTIAGPIIMGVGLVKIMATTAEATASILTSKKPKSRHGGMFLLIGTALTITGPVLISKSNHKMTEVKRDFMWNYKYGQEEKLESSIELKTQGVGLSLNYTF